MLHPGTAVASGETNYEERSCGKGKEAGMAGQGEQARSPLGPADCLWLALAPAGTIDVSGGEAGVARRELDVDGRQFGRLPRAAK